MWRNTMPPVRIYIADARALLPWFIFLMHWSKDTLCFAIFMTLVFAVPEWFGLSFPAAIRTVRRIVNGRVRPAVPMWKRRRFA